MHLCDLIRTLVVAARPASHALYLAFVVVLPLMFETARAASPTMSTTSSSLGTCGGAGDLCEPGADIFVNYPSPAAPIVLPLPFGLVSGDDITSLSWGKDSIPSGKLRFSVDSSSIGTCYAFPPPPSHVCSESSFSAGRDSPADIYSGGTAFAPSFNVLEVEADGIPVFGVPGPPATGLLDFSTQGALPFDDIDALATCDPTRALAAGGVGYFTLAPGSPTLSAIPATSADILSASVVGPPSVYLSYFSLGLAATDVIDALALDFSGFLAFSLAPGSPTLSSMFSPCLGGAAVSVGPADVLSNFFVGLGNICVLVPASALALTSTDNIDALDISPDGDNDVVSDGCDNCPGDPNNDQADGDSDDIGDACELCPGDPINDPDGDSLCALVDNCPFVNNPAPQADTDGDGNGDPCDLCAGNDATCELRANTFTFDEQLNPDVCRASGGEFVIVWDSYPQDGYRSGIFGQRFDSAGAPVGTEFQVNSYTANYQYKPKAACDDAGAFVVVWTSRAQDGYFDGLFAQRFDSFGARAGTEFQVATQTTAREYTPAIGADATGAFVIAWTNDYFDADGDGSGVFAQRFSSNGARNGTEFQVNSYTPSYQGVPSVAVESDGDFVVVWLSHDGSFTGVFGQRFNSMGARAGIEFQINSYTPAPQTVPSVGVVDDGRFVVTWSRRDFFNLIFDVWAQRFASNGSRLGTEFQVVPTSPPFADTYSDISVDSDGDFTIVWNTTRDGQGNGVFGRNFTSSGAPNGSEFQVNTQTVLSQFQPAIAMDAGGNAVVSWVSEDLDGFDFGVFYRLYDAPPQPPLPCPPAPLSTCDTAGKSKLLIKNKTPDDKDKLLWKFLKGVNAVDQVPDLADPTATASYALCLYDNSGLRDYVVIPPDPVKWAPAGSKGYIYKDPAGGISGITKMIVKGGDAGKPKAIVKGKGASLPDPLPLALPVTVQLKNGESGQCFTTTFNGGETTVDQFKATN